MSETPTVKELADYLGNPAYWCEEKSCGRFLYAKHDRFGFVWVGLPHSRLCKSCYSDVMLQERLRKAMPRTGGYKPTVDAISPDAFMPNRDKK